VTRRPRTYMPPEQNRVHTLTKSWLGVFWQIYKSDASLVLQKNGVGESHSNPALVTDDEFSS